MRVVVAPDKFKGCLTAPEVAAAIARGVRSACAEADIEVCPVADGGDGTMEVLAGATGGRRIRCWVTGPLPGTRVRATFGMLGDGVTAVVEMAEASGLRLVGERCPGPLKTTTYGTGELLVAAARRGAKRIILGIGGSATTDGGVGCAQACGAVKVHLAKGRADGRRSGSDGSSPLSRPFVGADLAALRSVRRVAEHALRGVEILVACDVSNPLTGRRGAARVFGPQKGATPKQVEMLDGGLARLARMLGAQELARKPGAGAAGGLGFGMMAFFGAQLRSGAKLVLEALKVRSRLARADLCFTGEGSFDGQSLSGKAPAEVARLCAEMGVPCVLLAGRVDASARRRFAEAAVLPVCDGPMSLRESMARARQLLADTAAAAMRTFMAGAARHKRGRIYQ